MKRILSSATERQLADSSVKLNKVIPIIFTQKYPESFRDFVEDSTVDEQKKLLGYSLKDFVWEDDDDPEFTNTPMERDETVQEMWESVTHRLEGFLVEVNSPIRQRAPRAKTNYYSWGLMRVKWIFGKDFESIAKQAVKIDEELEKNPEIIKHGRKRKNGRRKK